MKEKTVGGEMFVGFLELVKTFYVFATSNQIFRVINNCNNDRNTLC